MNKRAPYYDVIQQTAWLLNVKYGYEEQEKLWETLFLVLWEEIFLTRRVGLY